MKKKYKNFTNFFLIFFLPLFFIQETYGTENIVFLTLKNNEVNVRIGPSKKYPIKFTYNKKYLPLEILDNFETWRKIKDYENNSGWIHVSQLSKKKSALNINNNSFLYKKPSIYSKPIAKLEIGRLLLIKKCKKEWCKITTGSYEGWIAKKFLWGRIK